MLQTKRLWLRKLQQIHGHLQVVQITSTIAIFVGGLVLLGWYLDLEYLKSAGTNIATMKANTALCIFLSGVSLWLLPKTASQKSSFTNRKTENPKKIVFWLSQVCAIAVLIIGLLTLIQYFFNCNFGIDELLFRDQVIVITTSYPGRMGVNTALNFILIGAALTLLKKKNSESNYWYAQIFALIATLISLQALIGYTYKVKAFYGIAPYTTSMALHTIWSFIVLSIGILWVDPTQALMRVVTSDSYAGYTARRLLVLAIVVPFMMGWLITKGEDINLYDDRFAISLFTILIIIIFVVLIWQNAIVIERLNYQQKKAEVALEMNQEKVQSFIDSEHKQLTDKILHLNQELWRSVADLETLLEVIPIGIGITTDPECLNVKVNPALSKLLQISPMINSSFSAFNGEQPRTFKVYHEGRELTPEEHPMYYCTTHGVEVLNFEVDIVHENGQIVKLLEYIVPLFDQDGKVRGCIGTFLDITQRKQVEKVLQNHQKWLEDVVNLMPIPLLFIEPETAKVTFANLAADQFYGGRFPLDVPAEKYHTVYSLSDEFGNSIVNEKMPGVRLARGESLHELELKWHTCNGIRSVLIFADTLPSRHGYSATGMLVFQDITNLKKTEKALSLGYQRLHLLFNTANSLLSSQQPVELIDNIFHQLCTQMDLCLYFNYLVKDNSQVIQLSSYRGISQEVAKEIESLNFGEGICGIVAQNAQAIAIENVQLSTDSKTELIRSLGIQSYYCCPLITQGKLLGILAFGSQSSSNFTDNQKGMMQAVCNQIAIAMERASLITSLQQQKEQLSQANRMKDEFLAILSHELRSPLNAILGWAQLLRVRKFSDIQMSKALETIERNARVQAQLVEDLLDISRIVRGQLQLDVKTCNLIPIIESAMGTVSLAAQAKDINLQFTLGEEKQNREVLTPQILKTSPYYFLVIGDSDRLQQIIWNLLANAIKFTPQGGQVEVRLSKFKLSGHKNLPVTNCAQIQVIDTGIGINTDFLPYVFDHFRQADSSSTRSYGGLGLGLAIVRHLVELHGGVVRVESPGNNQGTTFTVNLPLLEKIKNIPDSRLPFHNDQ